MRVRLLFHHDTVDTGLFRELVFWCVFSCWWEVLTTQISQLAAEHCSIHEISLYGCSSIPQYENWWFSHHVHLLIHCIAWHAAPVQKELPIASCRGRIKRGLHIKANTIDYITPRKLEQWNFTSGIHLPRVIVVEHITGSRWQKSRFLQVENNGLPSSIITLSKWD